jgi:hypothetical protein
MPALFRGSRKLDIQATDPPAEEGRMWLNDNSDDIEFWDTITPSLRTFVTTNSVQTITEKSLTSCTFSNIDENKIKGVGGTDNPFPHGASSGAGAIIRRSGLWDGTDNVIGQGLWSNAVSSVGTESDVNDTTEGIGMQFATGAVGGNNAGIKQTNEYYRREWGNYMIVRIRVSTTSNVRAFIGWVSNSADIAGEAPLANISGVGLAKRAADTNWFTCVNDGDATEDRVDTTIAFGTAAVTLQFSLDSSNFSSKIGTSSDNANVSTELPALTTNLMPMIQIETSDAVDKNIQIFSVWSRIGA